MCLCMVNLKERTWLNTLVRNSKGLQCLQFGWVQSYGSRCVKPPLILGDVAFSEPITVKESVYAQTLTDEASKRHVDRSCNDIELVICP